MSAYQRYRDIRWWLLRRLPWWSRPWHQCRLLRRDTERQGEALLAQNRRIIDLKRDVADLRAANAQLFSDNQELAAHNAELQRQLRITSAAPAGSGRAMVGWEQAGGAKPEFVIVGIDRGAAGGKRIYASRDLGGPSFGIEPQDGSPTWKLVTFMARMLTIDKPGYGEALERMAEIWGNWDDTTPALPPRTRRLPRPGAWTEITPPGGEGRMYVGPPDQPPGLSGREIAELESGTRDGREGKP